MPTWEDALADKTTYPDDRKVTLADGVETTFADLRKGTMFERDYRQKTSAHARQREEFQREKTEFEGQKTAAEIQLKDLAEKLILQRQPTTVDEVEDLIRRDPVASRLQRDIAEKSAKMDELLKRADQFEAGLRARDEAAMIQEHRSQLARLQQMDPDLVDPAKQTEFVEWAKLNNTPRLDIAWQAWSEQKRWQKGLAKAKEDATKEAYDRAKKELMQPVLRPQRHTPGPLPTGLETLDRNDPDLFQKSMDLAMADPDVLATLEGTQ